MDAGERAGDEAFRRMQKKINRIYGNAQREIRQKLAEHTRKFEAEDRKKRQDLADGKITKEEYERWHRLRVWQGQQWQDKLDSVTRTLTEANEASLRIVNGERVGVFAENATYQNFLADQAGIGGVWDIYDQATVSRMLADNPRLLPPKKLDRTKEKAWNRRQINNCVLQGILQGESVPQIADRMAQTTGSSNRSQMLRTARTSMTSAQNAGRLEAMRNQEAMGIRVQKLWIATLDKRTRDAHAALDGKTADVDKPFESELGDIMFPGDPSAHPANVYNCRCTLGYSYPDFPMQGARRRDNETKDEIEYQTYQEWKKEREGVQATGSGNAEMTSDTLTGIEAIKKAIETKKRNGDLWTLDEQQELGRIMAEEVDKRWDSDEFRALREREKEIERTRTELWGEYTHLAAERTKYTRIMRDGTPEEQKAARAEFVRISNEMSGKQQEMNALLRELTTIPKKGDVFARVLSEVRAVGGVTEADIDKHGDFKTYKTKSAETKKQLANALNRYPSDWIEKSDTHRVTLTPHWTSGRAYYSPSDGEIRLDGRLSTGVHELGHRFEQVIPGLLDSEKEFYARRTQGEQLEWMGRGYKKSERTRKDSFVDKYMGKDYGGSAYELFSMGSQLVQTDYETLERDPDMLRWVLGVYVTL